MKNNRMLFFGVLAVAAFLLTACAGALPAGAEVRVSPDGQGARVEFDGVVDSIAADRWVISGQTLLVNAQTSVDEGVEQNSRVRVEAAVTSDRTATALKIELRTQLAATPVAAGNGVFDDSGDEFTGVVESISAESWTIGGQVFLVNSATEIKGSLSAGDMAKVHFVKDSDGSMTATEIEPAPKSSSDDSSLSGSRNEFTGKVEAFSGGTWTVNGKVFLVTPQTEIKGPVYLGDVVKIHYQVGPDEALIATEIELAGANQAHNSEKKLTGILEQISSTQATISGVVVMITPQTVLDSGLVIGQKVKAEVITGSDGIMTALEIETFNSSSNDDSGSGSSNSGSGSDDKGGSGKGGNSGSGGTDDKPETGDDKGGNK